MTTDTPGMPATTWPPQGSLAAQEATYWNGESALAVRVRGLVAANPRWPGHWSWPLVGTERDAVRVTYDGKTFYLDDEGGSGWRKVTEGRGAPSLPHRTLVMEHVRDCAS